MQHPPTSANILKEEFEKEILSKDWKKLLITGKLKEFEERLFESCMFLYDRICSEIIKSVSDDEIFIEAQNDLATKQGFKKIVNRDVELQLRTGTKVKFNSLYAKTVPKDYKGSRHLSLQIFGAEMKSSPVYSSLTCYMSVICPSFEVGKNALRKIGIKANYDRIRSLSLSIGKRCVESRASIQLFPNESLADKRVIIGIDGGRTRTRFYEDKENVKRTDKYKTPWIEPKLFIITTIDENGKANKQDLPIYDSSFGDDETFEILEEYLINLQIHQAKSVQVIADGALWIWNRAKDLLVKLGVKKDKIIETLDYYHAMEHLTELMIYVKAEQKKELLPMMKQAIWTGDITKLKNLIKKGVKGVDLEKFNPYKYFRKNRHRLDYQTLRKEKIPIGSGIIESGIRRIINLRFKSPSSFWYPKNVEKLILMRAIALSGRWDITMNNLQINTKI